MTRGRGAAVPGAVDRPLCRAAGRVKYRGGMKNLPLSLATATISGAFTLLRPSDWSPGTRRAFVLVPGALAAATLAGGLLQGRRQVRANSAVSGGSAASSSSGSSPSAAAGAALAVGVGTLVSAGQALSLRWDASLERWLVRKGLRRPRLWMGAAVALATLAVDFLGGRGRGGNKADQGGARP